MKIKISIAAAMAVLTVGASAHATQFVVNGDFTQLSNGPGQIDVGTTVAGWDNPATAHNSHGYNFVMASATGSQGVHLWDKSDHGNNTWNGVAPDGGNFAAMDGDYETGPITQTISDLKVGKSYILTFDYAFGQQEGFSGATIQSLTETLGDNQSFSSGNINVTNHGFSGWKSFRTVITADSTTETLSFLAHGNLPVPPFALVSNVSLTGGVPEPATWTMMILGVGGIGAIARRRRASGLVAAAVA